MFPAVVVFLNTGKRKSHIPIPLRFRDLTIKQEANVSLLLHKSLRTLSGTAKRRSWEKTFPQFEIASSAG